MANIKLPLNILVLTGKSSNPASTFNQIVPYQIRDSLNGLAEFAWTHNGVPLTQPPKDISAQVLSKSPLQDQVYYVIGFALSQLKLFCLAFYSNLLYLPNMRLQKFICIFP